VGISLWRLSTLQQFHDAAANVRLSLYSFYSMSCLEASIFLVEQSYWHYKISWGKLLEDVKAKAGLQEEENDEKHQQQDHNSEFLVTFFYEVSVPQEEGKEEEMLLQQPISHQPFFCLLFSACFVYPFLIPSQPKDPSPHFAQQNVCNMSAIAETFL
jgi:hypothetical protein